jgi:hypothetical protein
LASAPEAERRIGYFAHQREATTAWAALVEVTPEGDPVEFLYTDAVTVNRFTQRLLGARVDGYVVGQVLLEPLLSRAADHLALLCFDDPAVLQRRLVCGVPVAVFAPGTAPHKQGAWEAETVAVGNGRGQTWWMVPETRGSALAMLHQAAAAMAPFGILDPFAQLRAAMAELRGEKA